MLELNKGIRTLVNNTVRTEYRCELFKHIIKTFEENGMFCLHIDADKTYCKKVIQTYITKDDFETDVVRYEIKKEVIENIKSFIIPDLVPEVIESIYDLGKDGAHDCVLSFRKGWLKNGATYRVLKISYKDWEAIPVKFDNSGLL